MTHTHTIPAPTYTDCGECGEEIRLERDIDGAYVDCPYCGNFGYI